MKDLIEIFKNFFIWLQHMFTPVNIVIILLFVVLILTGCSSKPEHAVKVVTQNVKVPLIIKCVDTKDVPKYHEYITVKINKSDSYYIKAKKLIIRDYEHQKYVKVVDALLKKCSQD